MTTPMKDLFYKFHYQSKQNDFKHSNRDHGGHLTGLSTTQLAEYADHITTSMYKEDGDIWREYCEMLIGNNDEYIRDHGERTHIFNLAYITINGHDSIKKDAELLLLKKLSKQFHHKFHDYHMIIFIACICALLLMIACNAVGYDKGMIACRKLSTN